MKHFKLKHFTLRKLSGAGLAAALATGLVAMPALAQGLNTPVSSPETDMPESTISGRDAGPAIPAGHPYVPDSSALENITSDMIEATGARHEGDALEPLELHPDLLARMDDAPETLIGWDSRTRSYTTSYPSSALVLITYNNRHLCTGFMVSSNTVVTSGHCVHTGGSAGSWRNARDMRVFAGRDGGTSPFGSCGVRRLHSVVGWVRDRNYRLDYGAMRLDCNVGNNAGWFGTYAPPVQQLRNAPTIIFGYPGDKAQQQWGSSDRVRRIEPRMVCYRNDTVGGHSGSPVWNDRNHGLAENGAWSFAVHGYGIGGSVCGGAQNQFNGAVRFRNPHIRNIRQWIDRN